MTSGTWSIDSYRLNSSIKRSMDIILIQAITSEGRCPEFSGEMIGWVLSGFSVGPQRVLSEYSGYSWELRLFIFEYSRGSQVGTSPRAQTPITAIKE